MPRASCRRVKRAEWPQMIDLVDTSALDLWAFRLRIIPPESPSQPMTTASPRRQNCMVASMTSCPTKPRRSIVDSVLWFAIGALGLSVLCSGVFDKVPSWPALIVGLVIVSLSVVAAFRHWGPLIPCMFFGMIVAQLSTSPISSSPRESLFKDLVIPIIGAVIGAMLGAVWDMFRSAWRDDCPNLAAEKMRGSSDEQSQSPEPPDGPVSNGESSPPAQ